MRSDAIATQDGVPVKSSDHSRRLVGTIRTTGTTTTEDSLANRFVWNAQNQVIRPMLAVDTTASWNYTTATWRQARAQTTNQLSYVTGDIGTTVQARINVDSFNTNASGITRAVAVGVDSTTTPSSTGLPGVTAASGSQRQTHNADYVGTPGLGYHTLVWLEESAATATTTWAGSLTLAGVATNTAGIIGTIQN